MVHEPLPQPPAADEIRLTDILHALSDPSRVKMLLRLADGEFHPCGLEGWGLEVQKSTVSHHLKTMREAGLIEYRLHGRNKDARLRREVLDARFPGLIAGLTSEQAAADLQR